MAGVFSILALCIPLSTPQAKFGNDQMNFIERSFDEGQIVSQVVLTNSEHKFRSEEGKTALKRSPAYVSDASHSLVFSKLNIKKK